ncbi:MAG: hypothetical protein IKP20_00805 [Candidatus Methanomethylophilaceae archaeon]|jgi:hypothetical protein|nr:hypothetical protein [Candidatus Methanomethylophilaceae archaeon]
MVQYQTVLMPLPKQRLSDKGWYKESQKRRANSSKLNSEINSILVFYK